MTAERMFAVSVIDATDLVSSNAELKRLCRHNDGRIAIVEDDGGTRLTVRVVTALDGPSRTTEIWGVAAEVADIFVPADQQPGVTPTPGVTQHLITKLEYREIQRKGLRFPGGGPARFKRDSVTGAINEETDSRPLVRFLTPTIDVEVGDASPTLTLNVLSGGVVDTTFNRALTVVLDDNLKMRFQFTAGVSTKTISTTRPMSVAITPNPEFQVEAILKLDVVKTEF